MKKIETKLYQYDEKIRDARIKSQLSKKAKFLWFVKKNNKILMYSFLVLYALLSLFPFFWSLTGSFNHHEDLSSVGLNPIPVNGWTLDNYNYLFSSAAMKRNLGLWMKNSFIYAIGTSTLNVFFNFLAGYGLARIKFRGKNLILWYLIVGMMIPAQITQIPQLIILIKMGVIGGNISNSIFFIGIIFTGMTSAPWVFMVRQFYLNISPSVEEAASLDGLTTFGVFFKISLKQLIPLMATMWTLIFMAAWNNYIMFTLWAGGDPARMTMTAGLQTITAAAYQVPPSVLKAATLAATNLAILPVMLVYFASLYFQRRVAIEGEK